MSINELFENDTKYNKENYIEANHNKEQYIESNELLHYNDEIPNEIKKQLLPYQIPHVKNLLYSLSTYERALDSSQTGVGKTFCAIASAKVLNLKPVIICPKSVISTWISVLNIFEMPFYGVGNYESMINCKFFTQKSNSKKIKCNFLKRKVIKKKKNNTELKDGYTYEWTPPKDALFIFDEVHRCKNKKTLSHLLLYTLAATDAKILMLSATAADRPENFALIGYTLRLYSHISKANKWIKDTDGPFGISMQGVHYQIKSEFMSRICIQDLGDLFPENQVLANCYDMDKADEIDELYEDIADAMAELKKKEENSGCMLARIMYARMRIEQYKIPTMIELINEFLEENCAVAVFVNFNQTLQRLSEEFKTDCLIHGDQSRDERQNNIDAFMSDQSHIIIANLRSGGTGISLQDLHGNYPRASIISPSWSAQDIIQALGRVHRANGKTKVRQRIVYCSGTIEEDICKNIKQKIKNISAMNDGDENSLLISGLADKNIKENSENANSKNISKNNIGGNKEISELDIILNRIRVLTHKTEFYKTEINKCNQELTELNIQMESMLV